MFGISGCGHEDSPVYRDETTHVMPSSKSPQQVVNGQIAIYAEGSTEIVTALNKAEVPVYPSSVVDPRNNLKETDFADHSSISLGLISTESVEQIATYYRDRLGWTLTLTDRQGTLQGRTPRGNLGSIVVRTFDGKHSSIYIASTIPTTQASNAGLSPGAMAGPAPASTSGAPATSNDSPAPTNTVSGTPTPDNGLPSYPGSGSGQ